MAAFMIAAACACLIACIVSLICTASFVRTSVAAQGTVVEVIYGRDAAAFPVFTFRDAKGEEHKKYSRWGHRPGDFNVGDSIKVVYSPSDPQAAHIDGFVELWMIATITGILGVVYLPAGFAIWHWPAVWGWVRKRIWRDDKT